MSFELEFLDPKKKRIFTDKLLNEKLKEKLILSKATELKDILDAPFGEVQTVEEFYEFWITRYSGSTYRHVSVLDFEDHICYIFGTSTIDFDENKITIMLDHPSVLKLELKDGVNKYEQDNTDQINAVYAIEEWIKLKLGRYKRKRTDKNA